VTAAHDPGWKVLKGRGKTFSKVFMRFSLVDAGASFLVRAAAGAAGRGIREHEKTGRLPGPDFTRILKANMD